MAGRQKPKGKKRKLMVFDDHIEVISARTNATVLKFSPREVIGTQDAGNSSRDIGKESECDNAGSRVATGGYFTLDESEIPCDDAGQPFR